MGSNPTASAKGKKMKKILAALALMISACVPSNFPSDQHIESGALCQGSKAWRSRNLCGPDNKSGLCIEAVRGPFVLLEVNSSADCPHPLTVGIKDTFSNSGESKTHWYITAPAKTQLHINKIQKEIAGGESLVFGTEGFNDVVDSSRCYVTWKGFRPKL